MTGLKRIVAHTDTGAIPVAEVSGGTTITNEGASDFIALTFPPAVAGYNVDVIINEGFTFGFNPDSGDTFITEEFPTGTSSILLSRIGQKATFTCLNSSEWQVQLLDPDKLKHINTKTASTTLSADECKGGIVTNEGAGSDITLTLPTAVAGYDFYLATSDSNKVTLTAGASDFLYTQQAPATANASVDIENTYGTAHVYCLTDAKWVIEYKQTPFSGSMYENNASGSAITVATAGLYYGWTTATSALSSAEVLFSDNSAGDRFTIGENGAGEYKVSFSCSFAGENSAEVECQLCKNGIGESSLFFTRKMGVSAAKGDAGFVGIITLAETDYVDVRFTSDSSTDDVTIYQGNLTLTRIDL